MNGNTSGVMQPRKERATIEALDRERHRLATRIGRALAAPMTILGLVWLVLLVVDLTRDCRPC